MLISFEKKFIFIHVYKVAGSSINKALKSYQYSPSLYVKSLDKISQILSLEVPYLFDRVTKFEHHVTASELKKSLSPKVFNTFYKFGFVRNPWDWQVSLYHYARKEKTNKHHQLIKSKKNFDEYIDWLVNDWWTTHEIRLQKSFLYDEQGNCLVDFIGKYEQLDQDFNSLLEKLDVKASLPHVNSSKRKKDYRLYYNDKTAAWLEEAYKDDIATFGYSFE
ncbi:sulfotransferase family 2 domain-containing protein [Cyanothece sp. BG0011]|uniref:sulfotransferase family 2 domain-containing protein n=1 Tax=Cyanothece sp. BG0011 TaxID=2082950 RepID=UPI000D1EDFE9|nr:sulfotransferase family 2 domain-containing protein [Cyanothece sp. BG0011]